MLHPLQNGSIFLIQIIFDFYLLILLLRLLFQFFGINFYNPIAQFIVKLTKYPLSPLQKFLPTLKRIDTSILVAALFIDCIKFTLIIFLKFGTFVNLIGLIIWSIGDLFSQVATIFFFAILLFAILSWVMPQRDHPLYGILERLSAPILRPVQRFIPLLAGIDLSPLVAILLINLMEIVLIEPIIAIGLKLAISP